jgi:multidrug efflux pump subunit AcrA (membrane-fusion protein)
MARNIGISLGCFSLVVSFAILTPACEHSPASIPQPEPKQTNQHSAKRQVRATGKIRAVRELAILVPRITGQSSRLTLIRLVPTGAQVKEGDLLAEFDNTEQLDKARETEAKYDDLQHQVEQKRAENRANAAKRAEEMEQAKADLAKAEIEARKGPVLAEIDRLKNDVKLKEAKAHVASLQKSHRVREIADQAALRILELKCDRQKVALERARINLDKLVVHAPLPGMVALENTWRSGTMGPAQEGDQLYAGQPLLRIFDPSEMEVQTQVGEPDGAVLQPGVRAIVQLDAYPELSFRARLHSASPVATSAIGSPIKTFAARFQIEGRDPHLLPDLSAAVIIVADEVQSGNGDGP